MRMRGTLLGLALLAAPISPGTEIRDAVDLERGACAISITPRDHAVCAGASDSVTAIVDCGPGTVRVRTPEWFLDGHRVGAGTGLRYVAPEGAHVLRASCGSCSDEIAVTVLPAGSCSYTPRLTAAFADSTVARTTGIFQSPNIAAVTPERFDELRFLMRPVTLTASASGLATTGGYVLRQSGTNLQLFRLDGTGIPLPDTLREEDLPLSFLVNAISPGTSTLTVAWARPLPGADGVTPAPGAVFTVSSDSLRVRVGPFPGLAGKSLARHPGFEFMRSLNDSMPVRTAIEPGRHAERIGLPYRAYVVAHRTPAQWAANQALFDASGGYEAATVAAGDITSNTLTVWASGVAGGPPGTIGKPYDVVYDFGLDGRLDPGDLIDGLDDAQAGFYAVRSLALPGAHPVTEVLYTGGAWLDQDLYYPSDIGAMNAVPLVVVSHGNGHDYRWYDYLGYSLASHGYVVMAHSNNTGPGIQTASVTTLTNTDYLLGNLGTIAGGALNGHIDPHRLIWVGHSRGGEGVCVAYDRVWEHQYTPLHFAASDVVLIRSMAPTVFLWPSGSPGPDPHTCPYSLIWGQAERDVGGYPDCYMCQSQRIVEHAGGRWLHLMVQGATHDDWHSSLPVDYPCPGCPWFIGQAAGNTISRTLLLAELEWYAKGNLAAKDYLTHLWEDFRPSGVIAPQDDPPGIVAVSWHDGSGTIIDDFQSNPSPVLSSSGGVVTYDVSNLAEGALNGDADFDFTPSDPMNGCENMDDGDPYQGGVFFDWSAGEERYYEQAIAPGLRDFTARAFLSLRACQGTGHPETLALDAPLTFTVELRDAAGRASRIHTGAYGGLNRPYPRADPRYGSHPGWTNEWSTIRLRLADFENGGSGIDLRNIAAITLRFGGVYGSERGRMGLDQVELVNE